MSTVKPTVDEYLADVSNVRRGRLATIVLYHMTDHAALEGYEGRDRQEMQARVDRLRQELVSACPDFALVHDIADASKHAVLSVPKKSPRQISTSGQIQRIAGAYMGAAYVTAPYNTGSAVTVTFDSGHTRPLSGIVRQVLMMWEAKLFPVGPTRP
ncbi:hypothetical protein QYH69_01410 [Paraburkholderia sp. SARCC-3016]|uniref:hypothetical protein n=1 Tax=Paraburkholderia sp. SARCC-3016 TaxID=3058611 RepID=UPI0028072AE2|nr:hypothetical protein [Paraburkholderia sp. SARCC-3016]MDQ7975904.1 hypothetical protein [Paraburkholderia sp. SARCC-3016]